MGPDQVISYEALPKEGDSKNLTKLAVLKASGGLGTSMGKYPCIGTA